MKINSNTIKLEKKSYEQLETIVKKIASENKIENVSGVEIKLSKENGVVKFAMEDDENGMIDYVNINGKYYSKNDVFEIITTVMQGSDESFDEIKEKLNEYFQKTS